MRLIIRGNEIHPHFTLPLEVGWLAQFAEKGIQWISFTRLGGEAPLGKIHTETHEIHIFPGANIVDRQVVVLAPPQQEDAQSANTPN